MPYSIGQDLNITSGTNTNVCKASIFEDPTSFFISTDYKTVSIDASNLTNIQIIWMNEYNEFDTNRRILCFEKQGKFKNLIV